MSNNFDYDVVVIGAGPAGSTLACLLAQAGHDVLILEKSKFPRYQIGESLLPATVRDLADMLGIREQLQNSGFFVKRGATFSWGKDPDSIWHLNFGGPRSEEVVLPADVPSAYNVSRASFDAILLDNAIRHGVTIKFDCAAQKLLDDGERTTGVSYTNEAGRAVDVTARFVADASGQKSKLARQIGRRSLSKFFTKLAIWRYFDYGKRMPDPLAGNTLFQARDGVWIWYIPISDKMTSVGVVAPASSYLKGDNPEDFLARYIKRYPLIHSMLDKSTPSESPPYERSRICSEYSYTHSHFWKPGAFMLGDSACFVDVLLSSGVHLATYSAVLAAQSVNSILNETLSEEAAMNEFESRYRKEFAIFFDGLVGLYDMNLTESEYASWLRKLLIDTSGIAFESEQSPSKPVLPADESKLIEVSQKNLAQMRSYNAAQIAYDGDARMLEQSMPDLSCTLISSTDMRSWERMI